LHLKDLLSGRCKQRYIQRLSSYHPERDTSLYVLVWCIWACEVCIN